MARFKDTIMVPDKPWNRAVEVTIDGPDVSRFKEGSEEVEALGLKAWKSVNQTITIGKFTVKAKSFGR